MRQHQKHGRELLAQMNFQDAIPMKHVCMLDIESHYECARMIVIPIHSFTNIFKELYLHPPKSPTLILSFELIKKPLQNSMKSPDASFLLAAVPAANIALCVCVYIYIQRVVYIYIYTYIHTF